MPTPLFGHSLAADPADPSRIIASGGFTGAMPSGSAPREAVPPGLRGALEAAPGAAGSGSSVGVLGLNASYAVLRYDRMAGSGGAGEWAGLGAGDLAMPRGSAFHASWILSEWGVVLCGSDAVGEQWAGRGGDAWLGSGGQGCEASRRLAAAG